MFPSQAALANGWIGVNPRVHRPATHPLPLDNCGVWIKRLPLDWDGHQLLHLFEPYVGDTPDGMGGHPGVVGSLQTFKMPGDSNGYIRFTTWDEAYTACGQLRALRLIVVEEEGPLERDYQAARSDRVRVRRGYQAERELDDETDERQDCCRG